ncbi:putative non-intrinsic ABC protein 5 [Asimina triloba]
MDRDKYACVLEACSLKKDLEILAFGDQTIIGERGINLSGGQKQRIQIARALYQDADIYLFVDPFSAVDAHTGAHLFQELIYVTHQVEFLPSAELILVMRDGRITQAGKYNDILNLGTDFMDLVGAHRQALSALDSKERGPDSEHIINLKSCPSQCESTDQDMHTEKRNDQNGKTDGIAERKGQLVQEEEREKGRVGLSVYWIYVTTAYARALVPFILLAQVLFQLLQIGSNYWMAWAALVSKDAKAPVEGLELIEEIAMLALEVAYLEQLLLSLYRRASDQQIASSSPSNINERSRSTLKSEARLFQEARRLDIKPRRESPAVRSGRMFSPHAPINSSGEDLIDTKSIKKLQMPSIQRSQSSLTQCSVCSNRISSPKKNPGPSKRGHHSQPLSLLEEAVNANGKWGCKWGCTGTC